MPHRILILEDNKAHMAAMCKILQELGRDVELYCASDLKTAYQILAENTIQLFILDIILNTERPGDASGLKLAEALRDTSKYKHTPIIFTTSVEDPKLYSYSHLHCFRYIEKPYNTSMVSKAVLDALEVPAVPDDDRYVSFQKDHLLYSKQIKEIVYIVCSRKECVVHCVNDEVHLRYKPCKEVMSDIASDSFVQCSRSCIVNRTYIEQIDYTNRYIKLKNIDEAIEIGPKMKKEFKDKMDRWYQRKSF